MKFKKSKKFYKEAVKHIPGGVNSPVRAFKSVDVEPVFIKSAEGSKITDVDGNTYIDYIGSWGPMILGHAEKTIIRKLRSVLENGTCFGVSSEIEIDFAKLIKKFIPSIELVRMVNSGTEATMSTIRLARAFTGCDKIIKFEGSYHGHGDSFLIKAGSGIATLGLPDSPGVTKKTAEDTLTAGFNDIESVYRLVEKNKKEIAAIIIEPVAGNMGCIPADKNFLSALRKLCNDEKILLIFDEVMTGFRIAKGGAQEIYGIKPDLTTLGKIIGGGLPIGAYGGKKEIMEMIAPSGKVYQGGTFSGNPLSMTAGYYTLKAIDDDKKFYKRLNEKCESFYQSIRNILKELNLPYKLNSAGSMFTLFFTDKLVSDYESAKTSDTKLFGKFFKEMLKRDILLPPSQFEAWFISNAHTEKDLNKTLKAIKKTLKDIR